MTSRSARLYRERSGLERTRRGPCPAAAPGLNAAHAYPLAPPLPRPDLLLPSQGAPPPDRGRTTDWPPGDGAAPAP